MAGSENRLNCLLLSPFIPYPPVDGGRIRIYNILKRLSERCAVDILALAEPTGVSKQAEEGLHRQGFDVEVVYHQMPRWAAIFRALAGGRSYYATRFASAEYAMRLERRLESKRYDFVQCEYSYMAQYRRSPQGPPWVLDEHNVEFRVNRTLARTQRGVGGLFYRLYASREEPLRRAEEIKACSRMDHVLTVSEIDKSFLLDELPDLRVTVVPNAVDLDYFTPSNTERRAGKGGVFIGKMDYRPNVDAVEWFCREIMPLVRRSAPDFTFTIAGSNPTRSVESLGRTPGVRVVGDVADPRPYLEAAKVVLVPLRAGSGTRLKILEALAMEKAVVCTSIGCEGLEVRDDHHLLVSDDPDAFAASALRLLSSPGERSRLGREGRRLMEERYGWAAAVAPLEALCARKFMDQRGQAPPEKQTVGAGLAKEAKLGKRATA